MAGRRLDQLGEIGRLDVERAGIFQHARHLVVVEHAVDQRHDGEVLHRLLAELALALQRGDEVGRPDAGQGADIERLVAPQEPVPRGDDAGGVGMAERPAAGQRHLAHRAQDGVALAMADGPHRPQRSGSRMLT